jgi:hypothetical protein
VKYIIGDSGWPLAGGQFLAPGTFVDDTQPQWQFLAGKGIPMDVLAFDQATWDYMTSNGVIGIGYLYWQVRGMGGVNTIPGLFILDKSKLGGGDVLG